MQRYLGIYLDFPDAYPEEENSRELLAREIGRFDPDDYLQSTAKLNYLCEDTYRRHNSEQLAILHTMGDDEVYRRVKTRCQVDRDVVFFRHQLMVAMAENLMLAAPAGDRLVHQDLPAFRKTLFRVSGLFARRVTNGATAGGENEHKDVRGEFFRSMLHGDREDTDRLIGRYYAIFFRYFPRAMREYPKEKYDLPRSFREKTGVDLRTFLVTVIAAWGHYGTKKTVQERWDWLQDPQRFPMAISVPAVRGSKKKAVIRALEIVSADRGQFRLVLKGAVEKPAGIDYYNLKFLWEHPFFRSNAASIFPLDLASAQDRVTAGIRWILRDHIMGKATQGQRKEAGEECQRMINFYGRPLELYAEAVLKRTHTGTGSQVVVNLKDNAGADFVIYDPRSPSAVVFIEVTGSSIPYPVAMSGDISAIHKELRKLLLKSGKKRGKIAQLDDSITRFRAGDLSGAIPNGVTEIYPILLMEKSIPWVPGLVSGYKRMIQDAGLLQNDLERFYVMDLEELEALEPLVHSRGMPIAGVLKSKTESDYRAWPLKYYLVDKDLWVPNVNVHRQWDPIILDSAWVFKGGWKQILYYAVSKIRNALWPRKNSVLEVESLHRGKP